MLFFFVILRVRVVVSVVVYLVVIVYFDDFGQDGVFVDLFVHLINDDRIVGE